MPDWASKEQFLGNEIRWVYHVGFSFYLSYLYRPKKVLIFSKIEQKFSLITSFRLVSTKASPDEALVETRQKLVIRENFGSIFEKIKTFFGLYR